MQLHTFLQLYETATDVNLYPFKLHIFSQMYDIEIVMIYEYILMEYKSEVFRFYH